MCILDYAHICITGEGIIDEYIRLLVYCIIQEVY